MEKTNNKKAEASPEDIEDMNLADERVVTTFEVERTTKKNEVVN